MRKHLRPDQIARMISEDISENNGLELGSGDGLESNDLGGSKFSGLNPGINIGPFTVEHVNGSRVEAIAVGLPTQYGSKNAVRIYVNPPFTRRPQKYITNAFHHEGVPGLRTRFIYEFKDAAEWERIAEEMLGGVRGNSEAQYGAWRKLYMKAKEEAADWAEGTVADMLERLKMCGPEKYYFLDGPKIISYNINNVANITKSDKISEDIDRDDDENIYSGKFDDTSYDTSDDTSDFVNSDGASISVIEQLNSEGIVAGDFKVTHKNDSEFHAIGLELKNGILYAFLVDSIYSRKPRSYKNYELEKWARRSSHGLCSIRKASQRSLSSKVISAPQIITINIENVSSINSVDE